jgi:hypothetical protein
VVILATQSIIFFSKIAKDKIREKKQQNDLNHEVYTLDIEANYQLSSVQNLQLCPFALVGREHDSPLDYDNP